MTNVSIPQARTRLKTLPENLQDVFFSAQTAEIISRVGEQNHLPEEKVKRVAEAVGVVLLGFIHVEELAKEIQDRAQVTPELAKTLAASVENRILNSVRTDLEKAYAPVPAEPEKLEEIKKPASPPAPVGGPPTPPKPAGVVPKPFIDLSSLSKIAAPAPTVKPTATPSPTGLPIQEKWKTYGAPPKPESGALGGAPRKEDRAGVMPPGKTPVPPAPPPATPPAPAPVLLKRKLELEPLKPAAGIRLEPTSQFQAGKVQVPTPPKPARLEIGKPPMPPPTGGQAPEPARTEMTPPRVVHYSQWLTSITQVQPPTPPAMPAPKPPTPGSETSGSATRREDKQEVILPGRPGSETSGGAPRKEDKPEVMSPDKTPSPPAKN